MLWCSRPMWLNGSGDCRASLPRRGGERSRRVGWCMAQDDKDSVRARGHCLCGAIEIEIRGPLRDVVVCHCGQCRRQHGAPPSYTAATWSNVTIHGEKNVKWYQSSPEARRGFCRLCGSSLFWEPIGQG